MKPPVHDFIGSPLASTPSESWPLGADAGRTERPFWGLSSVVHSRTGPRLPQRAGRRTRLCPAFEPRPALSPTSSGPPPVRLRPAPRWHGRPAGPRARCCHSGHPVLSCCCTPCPQLATASCLSRATSGLVSAGAPSLLGGCRWIPTPNSRSLELYILQSLRKTQRTGDPSIYPSVTLCCSGSPCDGTTSSSKCISEKFSNETVVSQT